MYTMQIHYFCHTHGGLVRTGNYVSKCEDPPFRSQLEKWSLGFQGLCPALAISGIWFFTSVLTLTLYQPLHQFRLKDGIRRVPHYGLQLARVAGLPASVIDTATNITSQITEQVTWYLLLAITRLCHHLLGLYMLRRLLNTAPCVYISRTPISISHLRKHVSFTSGLMSTQLSMDFFFGICPLRRKWQGWMPTARSSGLFGWHTWLHSGLYAWSTPTKVTTTSVKSCGSSRRAMLQASWLEKEGVFCKN